MINYFKIKKLKKLKQNPDYILCKKEYQEHIDKYKNNPYLKERNEFMAFYRKACNLNRAYKKRYFLIRLRRISRTLHKIDYIDFWKIYIRQMLFFEINFKLIPIIEEYFANEQHIVESNILEYNNVFYDKKIQTLYIINDPMASLQFFEYKINYYKKVWLKSHNT